jgi:hypothetical protein
LQLKKEKKTKKNEEKRRKKEEKEIHLFLMWRRRPGFGRWRFWWFYLWIIHWRASVSNSLPLDCWILILAYCLVMMINVPYNSFSESRSQYRIYMGLGTSCHLSIFVESHFNIGKIAWSLTSADVLILICKWLGVLVVLGQPDASSDGREIEGLKLKRQDTERELQWPLSCFVTSLLYGSCTGPSAEGCSPSCLNSHEILEGGGVRMLKRWVSTSVRQSVTMIRLY